MKHFLAFSIKSPPCQFRDRPESESDRPLSQDPL